jgi:hypothetical protein
MKKSILMIFVFFVLVNWQISALVYGQTRELITGAFGFKLGETLDIQKFKFKGKARGLEEYREVSPRIPNKVFDVYSLSVSSISNTIVKIKAKGERGGYHGCKKIGLGLTAALTRKYGNPEKVEPRRKGDVSYFLWTDISGAQIKQRCGGGMFVVTYSSKALDKLFDVEKNQAGKKMVDDTGL